MPRGKPISETAVAPWLRFEVWGDPKTGKSSFALTAPTPIDYLAYDIGYGQLIPDLDRQVADGSLELDDWEKRKTQIFPYEYARTRHIKTDPEGAYKEIDEILNKMAEDLQDAAAEGLKGCGGTIVLDGGTMLNSDLTFKAQIDMVKMRAQRTFGSPFSARNAYWKSLLDIAKGCNRHLIIVHHAQEIWGDSGPTGEMAAAGDKHVEREVDVIIQTIKREGDIIRDADGKPVMGPGKKAQRERELLFYISECRGNSLLAASELPWMTFDTLYELIKS